MCRMNKRFRVVAGRDVAGRASGSARRPPLVIGLDCDGVLASDRLLWKRIRDRFPQHIPMRYADLNSFDWPRVTPETTALCLELSADPDFATRLEPMPHMAASIRRLAASGFELRVITARPVCVHDATWRWLRQQGIARYIRRVHCVETGLDKVPLARALGCAAFVEDNFSTAEALGAAGIRSYLLDAPYNRQSETMCRRVYGWPALAEELVALAQACATSERPSSLARFPALNGEQRLAGIATM